MGDATTTPSITPELADERWGLVQRVAASEQFQKSPRLRSFLLFICERALRKELDEIHEQHIGRQVYGRPADYNASEDNIVRVDARRLRKALEEYFSKEGKDEPLRIQIPKGSYVPVFAASPAVPETLPESTPAGPAPPEVRPRVLLGLLAVSSVIVIALSTLGIHQWLELRELRSRAIVGTVGESSASGIWASIFDGNHKVTIVLADVGYSISQRLTRNRFTLQDYLDGRYLKGEPNEPASIAGRPKMSAFIDFEIAAGILRANAHHLDRTTIRHARDMKLQDFRDDNFIVLGSRSANPWCELFVEKRNFLYGYDSEKQRSYISNRSKLADEQDVYYNRGISGQTNEQYGAVALLPNLSHTGKVLIIEGTTVAGTESAYEFVRNPKYFSDFSANLKNSGKNESPYFDVLIRTDTLGQSSKESLYVAHRVLKIERPVPGHP